MSSQRKRIDYLDSMRAILMLLGIPFHAGLAFSGEPWVVTNQSHSAGLAALSEFLHVWRMPTFFMIAGFFSTFILFRYAESTWIRKRIVRLGVPLLFGMMLLSPVQWLLAGTFRGDSWAAGVVFFQDKLWPPSSWWTMHLWFLAELLVYCLVLALIYRVAGRARLSHWSARMFSWYEGRPTLAVVCALAVAGVSVVLALGAWQIADADQLFSGLLSRNLLIFAPAFVLGCLLGADGGRRLQAAKPVSVWLLAAIGATATATVVALKVLVQADTTVLLAVVAFSWTVGGLSIALVCLRVAERLLDRASPYTRILVDSSLVVYLVHQPLILVCALLLGGRGLDPWTSWGCTVALVAVGSLALYELINRIRPVRWMFTGSTRRGASLAEVVRLKTRTT